MHNNQEDPFNDSFDDVASADLSQTSGTSPTASDEETDLYCVSSSSPPRVGFRGAKLREPIPGHTRRFGQTLPTQPTFDPPPADEQWRIELDAAQYGHGEAIKSDNSRQARDYTQPEKLWRAINGKLVLFDDHVALHQAIQSTAPPPRLSRYERHQAHYSSKGKLTRPSTAPNKKPDAFRTPNYTGDPKPQDYARAHAVQRRDGTIISRFPSEAELLRLVSKYGYDGHAAFAAIPRAHQPWTYAVDRNQGDTETGGRQTLHSPHPSAPDSPGKRSSKYKRSYQKETVMQKLRPKRWSDAHKTAVYDVLCLGRDAFLVAASLQIDYGTLRHHLSHIRQEFK